MTQPEKAIWKFPLNTQAELQRIEAPYIEQVLSIQMQDETPAMYAVVWVKSPKRTHIILRFLTGEQLHGIEYKGHLGTVQLPNDGTVLHYFRGGDL